MANRTWYFPCNPRRFDIFSAVLNYNYIYWNMHNRGYEVGDILYMYVTGKYKRVLYKYVVTHIHLSGLLPGEKDTDMFCPDHDFDEPWDDGNTMRIELVSKVKDNSIDLEFFRAHGRKGFMSPNMLSAEEIRDIEQHF